MYGAFLFRCIFSYNKVDFYFYFEYMKQLFIRYILDAQFSLPLKYINMLIYYLLPAVWVLLYLFYITFWIDTWDIGIWMGSIAWYILLVILFLKPLSVIFNDVRIISKCMVLRRQLWVMMLWFLLGHTFGTLYILWYDTIIPDIQLEGVKSYLLWWMLWGIIIFLLGITSNTKSVKFLKKNWKRLHMLVYPALLFIALHIFFISGGIVSLSIVVVYGILKIISSRWIKIPVKKYFIGESKKETV